MLIAWLRDQQLRQVDGAVALSPITDSTFLSPSFVTNRRTDPLLGPGLGPLMMIPRALMFVFAGIAARISPTNPVVSPVFGDLSNLPPTLVQVSEAEMLFDDARRYVHEARRQGSPVELQTWPEMVHVWQMFGHVLPEAQEALERIAEFVGATEQEQKPRRVTPK
jgi:acetyl esterase/lipase